MASNIGNQAEPRPGEAQWRCAKCLAVNQVEMIGLKPGPWACKNCGEATQSQPSAVDGDGKIVSCPVCGCPDLYVQRDFNRRLGLAIIITGAVLAPFTKWISLIVCGVIDLAIFTRIPRIGICYHCQTIIRRFPGIVELKPFDLNTSDKYLEIERERGW